MTHSNSISFILVLSLLQQDLPTKRTPPTSSIQTLEVSIADLQFPTAPPSSSKATNVDSRTSKTSAILLGICRNNDPLDSKEKKRHHQCLRRLRKSSNAEGRLLPPRGPTGSLETGEAPPKSI
ncbi:hypothetical protein F2Q68_00043503 [Brassica cretica]|uniref:Uncharacterized protein n=1 Tax=Brassica cretica TaxID=69181 RepID=A0A8S9G1B2_BRACR|nr:hypothetical protein F2Q68_00022270 [Brassica cretica]KAF2607781.1 hypothetical protein F2Q68_00043503 [Brassica cretica]